MQFSIELNDRRYNAIIFKGYILKNQYYYICKIPIKREILLPHFKEYGQVKQINKFEEAYYKEYGKIIKP